MVPVMGRSGRTALLAAIALTISVFWLQGPGNVTAVQKNQPGPSIKLLSPKAGDVLQPGDQVTIAWEIENGTGAPLYGCEQEIYLSTDHGKTVSARITPELAPNVNSYQWTVPNLPSKKAVLVMNYGCETGTTAFESSHPQKQAAFKISTPPSNFEEVVLDSADKNDGSSGPEVALRWHSTMSDVQSYQVGVSYDRGAHFGTIGETASGEFTWHLQPGFSGALTFRIVAEKLDGSTVESIIDPRHDIVVGRGQ